MFWTKMRRLFWKAPCVLSLGLENLFHYLFFQFQDSQKPISHHSQPEHLPRHPTVRSSTFSLYMSNWISTANCYFLYKPWQLMPVAQSGWIQVSIFIRLLVESYLGSGLQPVWNSAPVLTGWLWCIRTISWLAKIHFTPSNFLIVF